MATITSGQSSETDRNAASPAGDLRADARHRTVLQVAKLATERGDELCILRNVSAGGLRAEVYCQLAVGDPVQLELRTGRGMAGRVVWASGSSIGVAFDRKVPILSYLAHQAMQELGRRVRPPRVRIGEPGILRLPEGDFLAAIVDASQAGMRIRSDRKLSAGTECKVVGEGLGERGALVRWCRDGEMGVQLKQPLSFREFAQWRTKVKSLLTSLN
ncbi:PilZ domain-containing protein [Sphingomonas bacterium]|uniref:PilZ domain-containing protein n=1 Tax=Sphingomonas bacterium TaxID=1895847 RepID=UPI002621AC38|nr:PilZ domain-containing protein [Sphingomonas bacterium]MDB5677921.1 PilZ protein [Sphingomonas bacterium]